MSERCVNCGALLPEGAKLCTSCGKIVAKNNRLRTEPSAMRKPTPDVTTQSRVYSHKPTPTAYADPEDEPVIRERRPARPAQDTERRQPRPAKQAEHRKKPSAKGKAKNTKQKKSSGKAKFIIAVAVFVAAVLLLLYMLIYMLKVREAKKLSYETDSPVKMSYSNFGEAADNFFDKAEWDYDILSGKVTVEGENKGTHYKYVFEDGKVAYVEVGSEKLTDEREVDILVERMFL